MLYIPTGHQAVKIFQPLRPLLTLHHFCKAMKDEVKIISSLYFSKLLILCPSLLLLCLCIPVQIFQSPPVVLLSFVSCFALLR